MITRCQYNKDLINRFSEETWLYFELNFALNMCALNMFLQIIPIYYHIMAFACSIDTPATENT